MYFSPVKLFLSVSCPNLLPLLLSIVPHLYFCFDYTKAFDCVDHNKLQTILKEMGIPDFWEICM